MSESNDTIQPTSMIQCPKNVVAGHEITKTFRHEQHGKVAGGSGSTTPEKYQRQMIIEGTGIDCPKTNMRINMRTHKMVSIARPNTTHDGFDYSEDFDGVQTIPQKRLYIRTVVEKDVSETRSLREVYHKTHIYVNLKSVVGKGGGQTRSLREVYHFVESQLNVCRYISRQNETVYFANILDGDESHAVMDKFEYLLNLPEYADSKQYVYVGDLRGYFAWVAGLLAGNKLMT